MLAIAVVVSAPGEGPPAAEASHSQAHRVVSFAKAHLGKPYRLGATGLKRFDCSGLVYRVFAQAGVLSKIGGSRKLARGYYRWLRDRGRVVSSPRVGDLVVYGRKRVTHIGIYIGRDKAGRPLAISALTNGVRKHRAKALTVPFKAYLRVNITR